ncbi:hypothetical protein [Chryseolinea lacunae]|uniref:WGR domain-containing protein n=1 Tax=Chryseolinea lacunae TaxID=2801331 RepID=A0ABS1KMW1_9BACT|nr:hypothetical protein [Chryseolinea lacunae]MBL0740804.1 hypothetical protein [Chryseolinea lacunae]
MKLVKQVKLFFQEGTSDKAYEIDLCESGDGFLVNFRYGRRGGSLKEGTKTIFPVPYAEADKVFAALEQEKRNKGYAAAGEIQIVSGTVSKASSGGNDKRKKAIVKLLKAASLGEEPEHWQLSRIIWRAGDLKIAEAIPYILQVADPSDPANIYSAVWAVGRCGTPKALGFIQNLQQNKTLPAHVQQLVTDVLLKLTEGADKTLLHQAIVQTLPAPFRKSLGDGNYRQLEKEIREYLFELKTAANDYLIGLYQLSREDAALHKVFLSVLNDIPLAVNYFKYVRTIFKTAAMLQDYAPYGVIARNIEKAPPSYQSPQWSGARQDNTRAFSNKTKTYLTQRVVRQLRKYGEANDASYTELAAEILQVFTDADAINPYHTTRYTYAYDPQTRRTTSQEHRHHYDALSRYQALNYILYKNSPRYQLVKHGWVCVAPYVPGGPTPTVREEGFPTLWDKAPAKIIQLLAHSRNQRVNEFALKVWQANPTFENEIDAPSIILFLQSMFVETQRLGLDLAIKKYNPQSPDKALLIAMIDSALDDARKQAELWIGQHRSTLLTDTEFIEALLLMRKTEAHAWLRGFLAAATFTTAQAEVMVAKAVAFIMRSVIETDEDRRYITQLGDTLIIAFGENLRTISLSIIQDLFRHAAPEVHTLAGKILLKHAIRPEDLPEDFLQLLLRSDNVHSRGMGIALLGKFPEDLLLQRKEILVSFCLSPLADVRDAVKPIILKLTRAYPDFGKELVNLFVPAFLIKESYEGLHDDLLSLLSNELGDSLHVISKERTLLLLNSRYRTSQRIGQVLLNRNVKDDALTVPELVKLGSNPLEDVRKFVWTTFSKYVDTIKASKEDALKIVDSMWDDTRIFAFDFFRTNFAASDWDINLLVMLCDSTREDVEAFGREMITKFFDNRQGTDYLLKLSQHPSTKVQLFTTAYLQEYAAGKQDMLETLKPYFVTLLSQVNKGKAAKARVFDFLRKESLRDRAAATLATEIFTRVSISMAITEKAACIAALRDIRKAYPDIASPLVVSTYQDYVKA